MITVKNSRGLNCGKPEWTKVVEIIFRITSPDVIPSSVIQIYPSKFDNDLSRFVLVYQEFFYRSRIFWLVENVFLFFEII